MEHFAQLETFWIVLLGLCAAIAGISGACAAIVKFWRYAHRETDANTDEIADIKKWLASDKRRLEELEDWQREADEKNKLMLKGIMQIMTHELDNNHFDQLEATRDEIQNFLINN